MAFGPGLSKFRDLLAGWRRERVTRRSIFATPNFSCWLRHGKTVEVNKKMLMTITLLPSVIEGGMRKVISTLGSNLVCVTTSRGSS